MKTGKRYRLWNMVTEEYVNADGDECDYSYCVTFEGAKKWISSWDNPKDGRVHTFLVTKLEEEDSYYTYKVSWSVDDQEYVGTCEQLPYLSWVSTDQVEAFRGIKKVVEGQEDEE